VDGERRHHGIELSRGQTLGKVGDGELEAAGLPRESIAGALQHFGRGIHQHQLGRRKALRHEQRQQPRTRTEIQDAKLRAGLEGQLADEGIVEIVEARHQLPPPTIIDLRRTIENVPNHRTSPKTTPIATTRCRVTLAVGLRPHQR